MNKFGVATVLEELPADAQTRADIFQSLATDTNYQVFSFLVDGKLPNPAMLQKNRLLIVEVVETEDGKKVTRVLTLAEYQELILQTRKGISKVV